MVKSLIKKSVIETFSINNLHLFGYILRLKRIYRLVEKPMIIIHFIRECICMIMLIIIWLIASQAIAGVQWWL